MDRLEIRSGMPCLVIGEVAQAHEGSLGMAHAFVDAIAAAGADAVKFQTHIAKAESTRREPWRVRFSSQDETRYDYWKRMEFLEDQWVGLRRHAEERGLAFLSSPFSVEAVDLLSRVGVSAWKVASGELSNLPLLEQMLQFGLPILLSTGMSPLSEIDAVVARVRAAGCQFAVLQCTTVYPTPPEQIGLNLIPLFRNRYKSAVGLSDHSGTVFPGLAAAAQGIDVLEVHVTLSRAMFGPDVSSSLTLEELRLLMQGIRFIEKMRASPVDKDALAQALEPVRRIFGKSVTARLDLKVGTVLQAEHLTAKKPGGGIPPHRLPDLIGRRLRRDVFADEPLRDEDIEGDT